MKAGLALRVTQHLTLTPQLQQSIRLLQLSTLEVTQEVEQMLADNPFLERAEDDDAETPPAAPADEERDGATAPVDDADPPDTAAVWDEAGPRSGVEADWPARLDEDAGGWSADESPGADGPDWSWEGPGLDRDGRDLDDENRPAASELASAHERLQDHLHRQALALHLSDEERAALYFLIESLDDDGYLTEPLEALSDAFWRQCHPDDAPPDPDARDEVLALLRRALGWLQAMEPAGVGARDLGECLRLQIGELPNTPAARAALALCAQPLEWIARRDTRRLAPAPLQGEHTVSARHAVLHTLQTKHPRPI
ncbi:MAG: RNA polymerase factor sigma-54, partial [Tepidimonas taiwanensis]|nr:RNA polymerase factor sigma-54 [Tepidimonas taiwanensis]